MKRECFMVYLIIFFFFCNYFQSSASAEAVYQHPPVMVHGTAFKNPKKSTIPGENLNASPSKHTMAKNSLEESASLHITQAGALGSQSSIFMRGTNSNHTLILVDGIKANNPGDPTSRFDFKDMTIIDNQSIQIDRGSLSSLYGSQAMGGVVHIHTQKGKGTHQAKLTNILGSHQTDIESINVQGEKDRFAYNMTGTRLYTGGIISRPKNFQVNENTRSRDPYRNHNLNSRLDMTVHDKVSLSLFTRLLQGEGKYTNNYSSIREGLKEKSGFHKAQLNADINPFWQLDVSYAFNQTHRKIQGVTTSQNKGKRDIIQINHYFHPFSFYDVTFYKSLEKETFKGTNNTSENRGSAKTWAVGHNHVLKLLDKKWEIDLSHRLDHHNHFRNFHTYRVGTSYLFSQTGTTLLVSDSKSFAAPSLESLYSNYQFFKANPSLKPEKGRTQEIGFRQSIAKVEFEYIYFQTHLTNLIAANANFTTSENVGKSKIKGHEVSLNYSFYPYSFKTGMMAVKARDEVKNKNLLRRPQIKLFASLEYWATENLKLFSSINHLGRRNDMTRNTFQPIVLRAFSTVNLGADYRVNKHFNLFGRVENLLNKKFEEPSGYQQPGLTVLGGLTLKSL